MHQYNLPSSSRRPELAHFPQSGFVRLSSILAPNGPIPVGRSTWWQGVKTGRFPKPIKLGPRITAWRVEDIRALIERPTYSPEDLDAACKQSVDKPGFRRTTRRTSVAKSGGV
jgi:predicted DNA-binding transcriptional regulator AlpA